MSKRITVKEEAMFPWVSPDMWQEMALTSFSFPFEWAQYSVDSFRRSVLFWDVMRRRGNNYFQHMAKGQPPILAFDHEMIMDGRDFERPVNYALLRIIDRRQEEKDRRQDDLRVFSAERREAERRTQPQISDGSSAIIVIDPRAGHGPGIGGSKLMSQIGLALDGGYAVYFIAFFPEPEPGQTITDVIEVESRFVKEVARLHPNGKPFLIGNCQAGWAAKILSANSPELISGMELNGSPISYWAGPPSSHPMRNRGLLSGGVWAASFLSDLGNGRFDGAHIVAGFEDLNPANTLWKKAYNLYSNVDEETDRFLEFEIWWGGYSTLNAEEIDFIADKLFIGNGLETGRLVMEDGKVIDLGNLHDMVIEIFSSQGDNITPPPQALNWLVEVFRTDAEIKKRNLKIIYCVHPEIGHLGIFVSAKIVGREHRELIGSLEAFELLSAGIYELGIIENSTVAGGVYEEADSRKILYGLTLKEKSLDDIRALCGPTDYAAFKKADDVSKNLNDLYCQFVRPLVRPWINDWTAEFIRQLHPLRMQHQFLSDRNPWMLAFKSWTPWIRGTPKADNGNLFIQLEKLFSSNIENSLNFYRDIRDGQAASCFELAFGNKMSARKLYN